MKRFSLTLMALALVALLSSSVMAGGMTFGVKGGINLANITGDDIENNDMKTGGGGGVYMNYSFMKAFSVQPELLFMMKGTTFTGDGDLDYNLNYLDIPVLAKYTVPMEGAFRPSIFAGPYMGFLMSAKAKYGDKEEDIKDLVKSTDFGLVFGAGFDFMLSETSCINFDARYALGMTSIDDSGEDQDAKNTGIMLMVGYGFMF